MTPSAELLALTEEVCPSVNGGCALRLTRILQGAHRKHISDVEFESVDDRDWIHNGLSASSHRVEYWQSQLDALEASGVRLVRIDELAYPSILRMIHNAPPWLFVRGSLTDADNRAIAIVGTRTAGEEGKRIARELAAELVSEQITIVSGMAEGIDTAAHVGAIEAGGRTIAVYGTGITRLYPRSNRDLAERIPQHGACVSQFLPHQHQTRWTFPVRNIVTSGLSVGTVVVEAGETSGAKLQAHDALRHGKRLFLVAHLVEQQQWARDLLEHPGVIAVEKVDDIVERVTADVFAPLTDSADLPLAM